MTSKPNPRRANGHRRRRLRARILASQDTCHICGRPVDKALAWPHPASPVVDEVVPIAHGGTQTHANCRLAHAHCNRVKGAHSLAWARHRLAHAPAATTACAAAEHAEPRASQW